MATTEREVEVEYESDPDDTKRLLVMRRRRVASDDEEEEDRVGADGRRDGDDGGDVEGEKAKRVDRVQLEDSDGEGAVAEYDDEEEAEEYYLEGEDNYEEGEGGYDKEGVEEVDSVAVADDGVVNERVVDKGVSEHVEGRVRKEMGGSTGETDSAGEWGDDHGEGEVDGNLEGKKENEPFAVPTAGAFYMHDDRFGDSVGGRNR